MTDGAAHPLPPLASDTHGRPITPTRLREAMRLNIAAGIMGAAWFTVCTPQQILNVFYKNELGATAGQLGIMVALMQLASVFHLAAIFIYSRTATRKRFWMAAHVVHRTLGFVQAGVAVYAAQGGDRGLGAKVIAGALAVSWVLMTMSASGWWSWMADLVPEKIRGTFFGRRASVIRAINVAWFFGITLALDELRIVNVFYIYAAVFALAGLVGVLDILLHGFIPEPAREEAPRVGWRDFSAPVRNRNFLAFSVAIGAWSFASSVLTPFIPPYITAADGIGAPKTWLSINAGIMQLAMTATGTAWGIVMDRFGRKPAVVLGALHPIAMCVAVFFMTSGNYPVLLVVSAIAAGLLGPGFWDGSAQLMLTLTPQRNRNAYLSWYMAIVGVIAAGGSLVGGVLSDALAGFRMELWTGFTIGAIHIVAVVSLALVLASVLLLARIREGRERPMGFVAMRLFTPGVFRTFLNLRVITRSVSSDEAARALRSMDGVSTDLAVSDMIHRLEDPDSEVREEAARALGRSRSAEAVDALVSCLADPSSPIASEAAQALGQIGDPRAVPALVAGLESPVPEIRAACTRALQMIERPPAPRRAVRRLRRIEDASDGRGFGDIIARLDDAEPEVREEAARALGRIGSSEAVDALIARLSDPASTLRADAALALGQIGDARAIPALVESLATPSSEVQEACARALGDIGGREAIRHLLRLLDEKRADHVMATGAEAVSKLGILEAAWEILPRFHETPNPVLRKQLAIALGNLLGNPGEFYVHLTAETAHQGARLGPLSRGARRAIRSFRGGLHRQDREWQMLAALEEEELPRIRRLMEEQSYRAAIEALYGLIRHLVEIAIDRGCPDDVALEYAFAIDVRLGMGFWFIKEAKGRAHRAAAPDLLHADALLALYWLSVYRLPAEWQPEGE